MGAKFIAGLTVLLGVMICACALDANKGRDIVGYWILEKATVAGEDTDRLNDLYFDFSREGLLKTNIFGEEGEFPYEWKHDQIDQMGDLTLEYDIDWLSDSTIALTTEIRKKEFVLSLIRSQMLTESSDHFE